MTLAPPEASHAGFDVAIVSPMPRTLCLLLIGLVAGCATRADLTLTSVETADHVRPAIALAAFIDHDANTADVYLTDLSRDELEGERDVRALTGQIVHVHLFLVPKPGATPLDPAASTMSVRWAILSRGVMGVYAGGGYMSPEDSLATDPLRATITRATLVLAHASPNFANRLGACELSGAVVAPRDPGLAELIDERLADVLEILERP